MSTWHLDRDAVYLMLARRRKAGTQPYTLAGIARAAGMRRQSVYRALRPGARVSMETVAKLAAALGVQPALLCTQ